MSKRPSEQGSPSPKRLKIGDSALKVHEGVYIVAGGDIAVEKLTIAEAKKRCQDLPGCRGFTHAGPVTDSAVEIYFKNQFATGTGDWTTYEVLQDVIKDGSKPDEGWQTETLKSHNEYRAKHGVPALEWSADCAEKAQVAANFCAEQGKLVHNNHKEYGHGQNIFWSSPAMGAHDAVQSWYSEVSQYNFDEPGFASGTGHFTQVVWKDTAAVGMACDSHGKGYIVANYWPAGNMSGVFDKNVFKEGTSMQERKHVRTEEYHGTVKGMDKDVKSVIDSLPDGEELEKEFLAKMEQGWEAQLDYKPAPNGRLNIKFSKGGAWSSRSFMF